MDHDSPIDDEPFVDGWGCGHWAILAAFVVTAFVVAFAQWLGE